MSKPTEIPRKQVRSAGEQVHYRTPIKFGGRVLSEAMLFHVELDVEPRDGRRGTGLGSMPMGNVWAWPGGQAWARGPLTGSAAKKTT